jgi:thiol-disulfide isomerase/thioredoxin
MILFVLTLLTASQPADGEREAEHYSLYVSAENGDCQTRIDSEAFNGAAFEQRAADLPDKGREIWITAAADTPYRCVGGAISAVQKAGFIRIGFVSEGSSEKASNVASGDESARDHPEATPFDAKANAQADVDVAIARAKANNRMAIIIMGANWCHDSRALAGWFATPRFADMLASRYELVYVDVGYKDRNIGIAKRFGLKTIKGTPTVLIVDGEGKLLNKKDAPSWRNAASRSEDSIFRAFAEFTVP